MSSVEDARRKYIKLYKQLRKYVWTFETVECLAKFEAELLQRFPDMTKCRSMFNTLYNLCQETCKEDEDLQEQFDNFKKFIEENEIDFAYVKKNYSEEG